MKLVIRQPKVYVENADVGRFISIDPGLGGTGWAVWDCKDRDKLVPPVDSGATPAPNAQYEMEHRINWLCVYMKDVCRKYHCMAVVIEQPAFMEGGKGLVAARDGDLVSLSILVGAILGHMWQNTTPNGWTTKLIPVVNWKGNMKKEMTDARVREKLPKWKNNSGTSHESDAVGLGLYAKGMF